MVERIGPIAGFKPPKLPQPTSLEIGCAATVSGLFLITVVGIPDIQNSGFPFGDVWGNYLHTVIHAPYVTPILGIAYYFKMLQTAPLGTIASTSGLSLTIWGVREVKRALFNQK